MQAFDTVQYSRCPAESLNIRYREAASDWTYGDRRSAHQDTASPPRLRFWTGYIRNAGMLPTANWRDRTDMADSVEHLVTRHSQPREMRPCSLGRPVQPPPAWRPFPS